MKANVKAKAKQAKPLNDKQKAFIEHYLTCWNASEAVRRVGYKTDADVQGYRMLVHAGIRDAIDARLAEMGMSANEVLARLTSQARGTLEPFLQVSGENVFVDLTTEAARANLFLVKEIETERRRYGKDDDEVEELKTKIKIHDPQTALIQLGRHYHLFGDKNTTLDVDVSKLTDEQLDRIANGEDPLRVLADTSKGGTGTPPARA